MERDEESGTERRGNSKIVCFHLWHFQSTFCSYARLYLDAHRHHHNPFIRFNIFVWSSATHALNFLFYFLLVIHYMYNEWCLIHTTRR